MANQISGRIYFLDATQTIVGRTGNDFKKREVWITPFYFDRYSGDAIPGGENECVKIEFGGERCALLDSYKQGDDVCITFELRGRVYTDQSNITKCITSVEGRAIKIQAFKVAQPQEQRQQMAQAQPAYYPPQQAQPTPQYAPQPQYTPQGQVTQAPQQGQNGNLPF